MSGWLWGSLLFAGWVMLIGAMLWFNR